MKSIQKTTYRLVRYAAQPRIAVVESTRTGQGKQPPNIFGFATIVAHLYRGTYYPGSLPREDVETAATVSLEGQTLHFDLSMAEPEMVMLRNNTSVNNADEHFWETDFISMNFIAANDLACQVAVKPDGSVRILQNGKVMVSEAVTVSVSHADASWHAKVAVSAVFFGREVLDLDTQPLPFDVVRLRSASAALTAWCPIPDSLPFNEQYDFPIFHFGLLGGASLRWPEYAGKRPELGSLRLTGRKKVHAGAFGGYSLLYTVGPNGLAEGGALKFNLSNEVIECDRRSTIKHPLPEKDWTALQWENPRAPGYLTVACSREGTRFRFENNDFFSTTVRLVEGGNLAEGDTVKIGIGTASPGPGIRAQLLTQQQFPCKCFIDLLANNIFLAPRRFPTIDIVGRSAQRLLLHCQPTPAPGERFRLVLAAVDDYGNIADRFQGTVNLYAPVPIENLPVGCAFTVADGGIKELQIAIAAKGAFSIQAVAAGNPALNGVSNLIVTDGSFGPDKIYFGDIHTHSQLSDGRLHPVSKYREVALHRGCDFWALTDHCHDLTPERLALLNETMMQYDQPGSFVTIPAYEWTGSMGQGQCTRRKSYGHRNVYFNGPVPEIFDGIDPRSDSPDQLKNALSGLKTEMTIFNHFHCGDPAMFENVDEGVEISSWCSFHNRESRATSTARAGYNLRDDVFAPQLRVGVVAGSDHGTEGYYTGLPAELTAVSAPELTRDAIFKALKNGRTYATSGQKTLLAFRINDVVPGHSGAPLERSERRIEVVVGTVLPVQNVQIIRNGELWQQLIGFNYGVETFFVTDNEPMPDGGYYYVRVNTAQGHVTWSSPIYI